MNNNCNSAACYGPFRTSFDRMMQSKFSPFCQPSSQLVCNAAGNTVLDAKGHQVEGFQARRAHIARAQAIRRARAARAQAMRRRARSRKSREGFEGPPQKKIPVTPTVPLKPNGNGGKKKVQLGLADWCGFCKKLKSQLPEVKRMLAEAGIEVEMIQDEADLKRIMKENGQNGFPFAVLVDESGGVVDSFGGFMPAEPYVKRIKSGLKM